MCSALQPAGAVRRSTTPTIEGSRNRQTDGMENYGGRGVCLPRATRIRAFRAAIARQYRMGYAGGSRRAMTRCRARMGSVPRFQRIEMSPWFTCYRCCLLRGWWPSQDPAPAGTPQRPGSAARPSNSRARARSMSRGQSSAPRPANSGIRTIRWMSVVSEDRRACQRSHRI